ncbi:MAG: crotonase/enoyl-CoA hydratase family protein [Myxococcales bacterium]|nr:crotonase/enoyl-CoA hydratase family protein [Myxococcales bacterium]
MESSIVGYEKHDSVAVITMNDGKANALSPTMVDALSKAFDRAEKEANAVVLAGRPGRFSAGFDLKIMATGPEPALAMILKGGELMMRLYEFPKPVVMAVTGHALAGGVLLAATGDTRIGIRGDFKLGLNEVTNGMPVPILAHELARDRLKTSELIASVMHSKIYDPESAAEAGWLDQVVEAESLAAEAMAEANRLGALPNYSYSATKRSLRRQSIEYIRSSMAANIAELTGRF